MKKARGLWAAIVTALALGLIAAAMCCSGCRSIDAEKRADGSWEAHYRSWGLFTDLGYLDIQVGTNGVAHLTLNDLSTDVSTNHVAIITASGDFAGEIAEHVIEGLK